MFIGTKDGNYTGTSKKTPAPVLYGLGMDGGHKPGGYGNTGGHADGRGV